MEEEAPHAEPSSSASGSTHTIPQPEGSPQPENPELLIPSFCPASSPPTSSSPTPTPTGTLSRFGFKMPTSPGAVAPGSPVDRGQVSAITVVALLDKLVNMMEAVQDNQQRMEQRQADLENAVQSVQGDVTRLTKNHLATALNVDKLLERSRKTSGHLKEVRVRLDKQAVQVKKLENNHSYLLKRNHFKVLIFQEDNEIPTTVSVKDSLKTPQPSQYDAESTRPAPSVTGSTDGIHTQDEVLQSVNLSSDDELPTHEEQDSLDCEGLGATSVFYERRSDKFKRSSLKKVDSLKKAFSRQSIEKKMSQITTKIVPPEKREKIKKSFTPNHPKSPTAKSSSFKVSPMTFNVKKVRDGESPSQDVPKSIGGAHVEIPPLGSMDAKLNRAEVHTHEGVVEEMLSPSSPESLKAEFNGKASSEINGDHVAGLALPEQDDLGVDDEEDEEEEEKKEEQKTPVETAADTQITAAAVALEQVS